MNIKTLIYSTVAERLQVDAGSFQNWKGENMPLNVKLLRKIKRHILAVPNRFQMEWWKTTDKPGTSVRLDGLDRRVPKCGTVCCLAGWALELSGKDASIVDYVPGTAAELIGTPEAHNLFILNWWHKAVTNGQELSYAFVTAKTVRKQVSIVAQLIDQFIAEHK